MKTSLAIFLWLPLSLMAQKPIPHSNRQNADSIVAFFLGDEIFRRYVQLEDWATNLNAHNAQLAFQYNFHHPKFAGETLAIAIVLDSAGQFVPGKESRGIIRIDTPDSTWISAREALRICRDQAYRIKKRSLRLEWDSANVSYQAFQATKNPRDIVPGELVWKVDGEVLFRGDRYRGTFEVNVFTGRLTRRFAIPWD